jgi:hypothetical protein
LQSQFGHFSGLLAEGAAGGADFFRRPVGGGGQHLRMILQRITHLMDLFGDFARRFVQGFGLAAKIDLDLGCPGVDQLGHGTQGVGLAFQGFAHDLGLAGRAFGLLRHVADMALQVFAAGADRRNGLLGSLAEPLDPLIENVARLVGSGRCFHRDGGKMFGPGFQRIGRFMGPGGGAVGGLGQFLGPAAQRFHQVLGPGRGAVRRHRQVTGAQVEDITGFPGPVGGALGNGLHFDGLAFQGLGDGLGPKVGVFRHLRQLHDPLVYQVRGVFAPFRRLFGGPGQVAGLAAKGFGNFVDTGFGLVGRIDHLPQVPAQRLGIAPQALPPLPERYHHPQQRQRRQGPGGQPADFVRQKFGDVAPAQHRLDVIINPP